MTRNRADLSRADHNRAGHILGPEMAIIKQTMLIKVSVFPRSTLSICVGPTRHIDILFIDSSTPENE